MASNIFSRLLPAASDGPLETDPLNDAQHAMDIDEENFGARFEPQDLEHLLADTASSHMTLESRAVSPDAKRKPAAPPGINTANRGPSQHTPMDNDDDDVPQSLLLERGQRADGLPPPVPGPSTRQTRAQWDATRRQHRLHDDGGGGVANPAPTWGHASRPGQFTANPKEKALWLWVNQTDLDTYMREVYEYYIGCGIYSMLLRRVLTLL